jgi:hypothetical protein
MEVTQAAQRSVLDKATGLAKLASLFEVLGWVGAVGAVIGAIVIGSEGSTTTALGGIEVATVDTWPFAISFGFTAVLGSLVLVLIARALGLFAAYAIARSADPGQLPPTGAGGTQPPLPGTTP